MEKIRISTNMNNEANQNQNTTHDNNFNNNNNNNEMTIDEDFFHQFVLTGLWSIMSAKVP